MSRLTADRAARSLLRALQPHVGPFSLLASHSAIGRARCSWARDTGSRCLWAETTQWPAPGCFRRR